MPKRVVWVLGSGFSVGVGGPLLNQIFDEHRLKAVGQLHRVVAASQEEPREEPSWSKIEPRLDEVRNVFLLGIDNSWTGWRNAEEYLELLDAAASGSDPRALMLLLHYYGAQDFTPDMRSRIALIAKDARAYFAAVCAEYSERAEDNERWLPYKRWAALLEPSDTVITFNYDQVVEKACELANRPIYHCVGGNAPGNGNLLKLHGSVDWVISGSEASPIVQTHQEPFASILNEREVAIGVPGPSKRFRASNLFQPQWDKAERALREADSVVFVGYRFPETDSDAKYRLLGALGGNTTPDLPIRLVLGPSVSDDVRRLDGLLQWTLRQHPSVTSRRKFEVIHEPMYAQDFLTVFWRDGLGWPAT
ncbi:MAG: SIR2 family protein [Myxococcales bacterium]